MKFALFLYDKEDFQTMDEAAQAEIVGQYGAYSELLEKAGAFVFGEPLDHSGTSKTLRPSGGIEDGPYGDTHEQLGGFYIIEAPSHAEAMDWARKCPAHAHGGHVEVRPVPNYMDA
ncbi:MAG: YciI family protein [Pseudomonadota bacterium]